jgi:hypothetical protein
MDAPHAIVLVKLSAIGDVLHGIPAAVARLKADMDDDARATAALVDLVGLCLDGAAASPALCSRTTTHT